MTETPRTLRSGMRAGATRMLRSGAGALGFDLVRQSFYSPLPAVGELDGELWARPNPMLGVSFDLDAQFLLLEERLSPAITRFGERLGRGGNSFRLDNGMYESVDAETLYAMVSVLEPRRIVELGSGSSSHVIAMALEDAGSAARYRVFDPFPWTASALGARPGIEVLPLRADEVPMAEFEALEAYDILFIDTTHTVKTGGDVSHLLLNVLPRLAPGVHVHIHDIFLPWEYPRHWVVQQRRAWAEQYLLQAFLAFNSAFSVTLAANALAQADPERLAATIPSFRHGTTPGAFWLQRVR